MNDKGTETEKQSSRVAVKKRESANGLNLELNGQAVR